MFFVIILYLKQIVKNCCILSVDKTHFRVYHNLKIKEEVRIMYKNTGRKIKGFSIFLAWAIIAVCAFFAFYRLFSGTIDTQNIIISVAIVVAGSLIAMIVSWFLYAYGAVTEASEKQNENLETLIIAIDDLSKKIEKLENKPPMGPPPVHLEHERDEIPLGEFKLPESREELFQSQLKKLKKDYEMSRITYDEYEEGKRILEEKYR